MKHINKFNTTEEYTLAISDNGSLSQLKHYVAYDTQSKKISLKQPPKPQTKTMKFVFGENEINTINQIKMSMPLPSWVLIGRKDLFKSIKYNGKELLTEPTVDPIDWTIEGEVTPIYLRQEYLLNIILNQETMDWNSDYVLTIQDVLGKELPEVGDEILLEVEFKDGLTDLSAMHTALSVGLAEISSNLFEDCTEVTNFAYAFDNSMLIVIGITYANPLKSSCPVDKDGTPLYERSNGKEGYATVTDSRGCFFTCENMSDYNSIPGIYGGKYFSDKYKSNILFVLEGNSTINEVLEDGSEKEIKLPSGETIVEGLPYGFNTGCGKGVSTTTRYFVLRFIDMTSYDTSKIKDFGGMFEEINSQINVKLLNFDTSNAEKMDCMFNYSKIYIYYLDRINTSKVTSMYGMFSGCHFHYNLDFSNFNTSNVINMNSMFNGCTASMLNLSSFDTSNVTDMSSMFSDCTELTSLDLNNFDTTKVISMAGMFFKCENLTSLILGNFNITKVTSMNGMFYNCNSLTYIKCKQSFKDWCLTNQDTINLPESMREGGNGTWDIVD